MGIGDCSYWVILRPKDIPSDQIPKVRFVKQTFTTNVGDAGFDCEIPAGPEFSSKDLLELNLPCPSRFGKPSTTAIGWKKGQIYPYYLGLVSNTFSYKVRVPCRRTVTVCKGVDKHDQSVPCGETRESGQSADLAKASDSKNDAKDLKGHYYPLSLQLVRAEPSTTPAAN